MNRYSSTRCYRQVSVLLLLGVVTNITHAATSTISTCIDGMTLSITSNDEKLQVWREGFAAFFANAGVNKADAILDSFSQEDGSRAEVAEEMAEFDKFERYAETKYSNVGKEALLWGDYWIRNVTYQFKGQNVVLHEPMLCTQNNCQMTTLSENGDADSEVLNLFLERVGISNQNNPCNANAKIGTSIDLFPNYRESNQNPITVQFSPQQISPLNDRAVIEAFAERCLADPKEEQGGLASFNPQCFSGDTGTIIPAVEVREDGTLNPVYFGVDVLTRVLASPDAIQTGVSLKLSNSRTLLVKLRTQVGKEYIVMLPFQTAEKISLDMIAGAQATVLMRPEIISFLFKEKS